MAGPGIIQPLFIPTPPDKGSFPIDREGVCKDRLIDYLKCLKVSRFQSESCREEIKVYLKCRMDNNLMDKEDFAKLGFHNEGSDGTKK